MRRRLMRTMTAETFFVVFWWLAFLYAALPALTHPVRHWRYLSVCGLFATVCDSFVIILHLSR